MALIACAPIFQGYPHTVLPSSAICQVKKTLLWVFVCCH
jgi:hypothetical protein